MIESLTPIRRPHSVRRTTTHDSTRPDGIEGPVHITARGRDLVTGPASSTGPASGSDDAALAVVADRGTIVRIASTPAIDSLDTLVGEQALAGFRRRAGSAIDGHDATHGLLAQLVDDLPTALMLSGRVLRTNGIALGSRPGGLPIDICAGWIDGGTLVSGYGEMGPPLRRGPDAAPVERDDDPRAWHDHDALPTHATRRRRRIDVWLDGDDDHRAHVDAFFRDTHADGDGVETVVHQYGVEATIDVDAMTIEWCEARPGPLPYPECPGAAASAARLSGLPVDGLRRSARSALLGPTTCTHLTDTLGCLEGVGPLLRVLRGGPR